MSSSQIVYARLNSISISGTGLAERDRLMVWIGYGQTEMGYQTTFLFKDREELDNKWKFPYEPMCTQTLHIYLYKHHLIGKNESLASVHMSIDGLTLGVPATRAVDMRAKNPLHKFAISVSVQLLDKGAKPFYADNRQLMHIDSGNGLLTDIDRRRSGFQRPLLIVDPAEIGGD